MTPRRSVTAPTYMAFDCLYVEDRDLRPLQVRERRTELEAVVGNEHSLIFLARRLAANGLEAWAQVLAAGYEGMVANRQCVALQGRAPAVLAQGDAAKLPRG